jgi:GH24 family phage-related lysozyme (muramidase)
VFALLPWVTLGFGSPVVYLSAAVFLGSAGRRMAVTLWASAALYAAAVVVFTIGANKTPGSDLDGLSTAALVVMMVGAGLEAIALSPWVARRVAGRRSAPKDMIERIAEDERADLAANPALRLAIRQREQRALARQLIAEDPGLADSLHIGRPDLQRDFADGGLIDVNHVPHRVLTTIPGVDTDMADRIITARERLDGLGSPADLVVHADVPSEVVEAAEESLIFRPD